MKCGLLQGRTNYEKYEATYFKKGPWFNALFFKRPITFFAVQISMCKIFSIIKHHCFPWSECCFLLCRRTDCDATMNHRRYLAGTKNKKKWIINAVENDLKYSKLSCFIKRCFSCDRIETKYADHFAVLRKRQKSIVRRWLQSRFCNTSLLD
jgi:hypothetical protein